MTETQQNISDIRVKETYYDTAQTRLHTVYFENELGYAQKWVYFEDGQLYILENYKDGRLDGERYEYYPTGELKECAEYIDGLLDGRLQKFDIQGRLREECDYYQGQKHGCDISYFANQRIQRLYLYTHGQPDGTCTEKYENGRLKEQHFYQKGILHQKSEFFNEQGVLERKILYHQGNKLYEEYLGDKGERIVRFFKPSGLVSASSKDKKQPMFHRHNRENDM